MLDPSIPFRALGEPVRLMSPQEHQDNALARQLRTMQVMNAEQEQQDRQQQRMQQNALAQAFASPKARTADGGFDYGYLSQAQGIAPETAMQFDQRRQENMAEKEKARRENEKALFERQKQQLELIGQVAGAAKDQATYAQGLATLQGLGIDTSTLPQEYNPAYVQQARNQILTAKDQLDQVWKEKGYQLDVTKQQETARNNRQQNSIAQGNLRARQAEMNRPVYDPNIGGWVSRDGTVTPARLAPAGQVAPGQAAPVVVGKGKPPAGYRWKSDGGLEPIPGGPADKKTMPKAKTELQAKSSLFGKRAEEANRQLLALGTDYSPLAVNIKSAMPNFLAPAANKLLAEKNQRAEQAQRDFINAVLRLESGAVISEQEFDNAKLQYFPQPGDKPETIKQKARNRMLVIQELKANGGDMPADSAPAAPAASSDGWSIQEVK